MTATKVLIPIVTQAIQLPPIEVNLNLAALQKQTQRATKAAVDGYLAEVKDKVEIQIKSEMSQFVKERVAQMIVEILESQVRSIVENTAHPLLVKQLVATELAKRRKK